MTKKEGTERYLVISQWVLIIVIRKAIKFSTNNDKLNFILNNENNIFIWKFANTFN